MLLVERCSAVRCAIRRFLETSGKTGEPLLHKQARGDFEVHSRRFGIREVA
jgi:hypothetical protein